MDCGPGLYLVGRDPGLPGLCGCYPGFAFFHRRNLLGARALLHLPIFLCVEKVPKDWRNDHGSHPDCLWEIGT